jgi:protein-tyrosine phosphatase
VAQLARPVAKARPSIPFTAASVTAKAAGTWTVSWTAPRWAGAVKVYLGTSAKKFGKKPVATVIHASSVTVRSASPRPWVKLVPRTGKALTVATRSLGLASDPNLRDIGGYRTRTGRWVRSGVVYRSQALALTAADLAVVNTLRVTGDYDLRTTAEATKVPDVVPTGAIYVHLNVLGDSGSASIPSDITPEQAVAYMTQGEVSMVDSAAARAAYKSLFSNIATERGASLYHCTAGKDRAGWATAALLTLLGVPDDVVMNDYLLSNTYYLNSPAVQAQLAAMPDAMRAAYTPFMEVRAGYLQSGLNRVKQEYGSMTNYFTKGLGLDRSTVAALKAKLLVGTPSH